MKSKCSDLGLVRATLSACCITWSGTLKDFLRACLRLSVVFLAGLLPEHCAWLNDFQAERNCPTRRCLKLRSSGIFLRESEILSRKSAVSWEYRAKYQP